MLLCTYCKYYCLVFIFSEAIGFQIVDYTSFITITLAFLKKIINFENSATIVSVLLSLGTIKCNFQ